MEDGFIILVFIAIAVINGIGQKRRQDAKKRKQGQMGAPPRPPSRPRPEAEPGAVLEGGAKARSSEGLIPSDVWEEILGLARGTPEAPPKRHTPSESPQAPPRSPETVPGERVAEVRDPDRVETEPGRRVPRPPPPGQEFQIRDRRPRPRAPEEIRRSSAVSKPGKEAAVPAAAAVPAPVSSEPAKKIPDPKGERKGREAEEARSRLFADGSVEELRKAIILKEVLGPPLSLRDEGG